MQSSLTKTAYIITAFIVAVPLLLYCYLDIQRDYQALVMEKEKQLVGAASLIVSRLPDNMHSLAPGHANEQEKVRTLNRLVQPVVNDVTHLYAGVSVGIYSHMVNRIVAIGPDYHPNKLIRTTDPIHFKSYETGKPEILEIDPSVNGSGKPVLNLTFPIYENGGITGHAWASMKLEDIRREYNNRLLSSLLMFLAVWLLLSFLIYMIFNHLNNALAKFAAQIRTYGDSRDGFRKFPQLLPVLDTITEMQGDIKKNGNISEKLRQIIDKSPLTILILDAAGSVEAINEIPWKCDLPLTRADIIGKPFKLLTDALGLDYKNSRLVRALAGEATEQEHLHIAGRDWLIRAFPLKDPQGNITGAAGILSDITDHERMRSELTRLDRLNIVGQLAASVAHEVRNPLTVVRGYMQFIAQKDKRYKSQVETVTAELDRANEIISSYLSLARNRNTEKVRDNLNKIIRNIAPLIEAEALKRNNALVLALADDIPDSELNPEEIKQLVLNMANNGLDAMRTVPKGTLAITTAFTDKHIELTIADTGCGIPPEALSRIFEPFYTSKTDGTGLGLAICQSIAEKHKGTITVKSEIGQGTALIIRFPV